MAAATKTNKAHIRTNKSETLYLKVTAFIRSRSDYSARDAIESFQYNLDDYGADYVIHSEEIEAKEFEKEYEEA